MYQQNYKSIEAIICEDISTSFSENETKTIILQVCNNHFYFNHDQNFADTDLKKIIEMLHIKPLKPSELRYSQDSISNTFDSKSRHSYVPIGATLDDLIEGRTYVGDIPEISVQKIGDTWVSADNRRLWVFKQLEKFRKCETIPVTVARYIPPAKKSSTNDGLSVKIRGGGNPGGKYFYVLPVFEDFLKDHDNERQELENKIVNNQIVLHQYIALVSKLNSNISNLRSEKKDEQASYDEIGKKLNRSREINQKYKEVISERGAKIEVLSEKLKNTLNKLSKVEENNLQNKDKIDESLSDIRTTKRLEDKVHELESQLSNSRENYRKQIETYKNIEAAYIEKIRVLETENETLKHSQSATQNAKNETTIRSVASELERMNKNYRVLKRINTSDARTIENLQNEIETIKDKNDRLEQVIANKDKGIMEIRRLTVLYGPAQESLLDWTVLYIL